jgi:hypothetical protein
MKSYNSAALRGIEYDDMDFKKDMYESSGITIPDHLLYKPEMNDWMLNEMHGRNVAGLQRTVNPTTSKNYTAEEALNEANKLRSLAKNNINSLMS